MNDLIYVVIILYGFAIVIQTLIVINHGSSLTNARHNFDRLEAKINSIEKDDTDEEIEYWGKVTLAEHLARYMKEHYGTYDISKGNKRIQQKSFWIE